MNIMKDIAGLKWAPETLINILILEKSIAATAKAINKTVIWSGAPKTVLDR